MFEANTIFYIYIVLVKPTVRIPPEEEPELRAVGPLCSPSSAVRAASSANRAAPTASGPSDSWQLLFAGHGRSASCSTASGP